MKISRKTLLSERMVREVCRARGWDQANLSPSQVAAIAQIFARSQRAGKSRRTR